MASLKPGVWPVMKLDKPLGKYEDLCQRAGPVVVIRDGRPPYKDRGMFGINIHRGGVNGTPSEGCQTLPPDQWGEFIATITAMVKHQDGAAWRQTVVTYALLDGTG